MDSNKNKRKETPGYNLRNANVNKSNNGGKNREDTASNSSENGAISPRSGMDNSGVNRAGRPAGLDSSPSLDSSDIIDTSSNLNGISEHSQCAQSPVHLPSTQLPSELYTFMTEMKRMFGELASQVNNKLDRVVNDISAVKHDLEMTKRTVSDMEASLTTTSDRLISIEKEDLPRLRAQLENKLDELEVQVTLAEMHNRKQNLLVYGVPVPANPNENVIETIQRVFSMQLNISREEASSIPVVNAHRLPQPRREHGEGSQFQPQRSQPPAIIIRFARMMDRDRLLHSYEHRPRRQPGPPGSDANDPSSQFSYISIRTDLPPKMKRERGRLASVAYDLRKNKNLSTRIKVVGTKVLLQTRKAVRNGGAQNPWIFWSGQ